MVVLHEISYGALSSLSTQAHRYDVFLSFRGFDTRLGFTYNLYNALMHANIATFLDDEEIETGEDLKPELESVIKASRASIIVLSKNYAESRWCLNELVLILERRRELNHIVIPIFYHVEPTHVRNQLDTFGDAMAKHRQRMEAEKDANIRNQLAQKMDQWINALTEVADLKGEDANGRRCDEKSNGILDVQNQLYGDITKSRSVNVHLHYDSMYTLMIEKAIARKKAFLVLDDIGCLGQLDVLLGSKGFYPGTKIIITTKDSWLTEGCALFKMNVKPKHATYELKVLSVIDSEKLLCFYAFMCNYPRAGYEDVSKNLVKYCQGHPMALKVLGRSLYNRDLTYWEGYIDRIKKENDSPINNVLRMSLDSLPSENDRELFKHIACFFVGMDRDVAVAILEACDIETRSGITNLIDRCLLSIEFHRLMMHQLVQEMGRFMVRKESLDKPWERSRVWGHESFRMLKEKKGKENVLGLTVDMRMLEKEKLHGSLELKTDAFTKMDRLMLLQLNYVQLTGSYKNFPQELRWLCLHGFPSKSLPSKLRMEQLVALDMSYSNIESFGIWYSYPQRLHKRLKQLIGSCSTVERLLGSLKILILSFCEQLCSLGGFEHLPKLERLIVRGCIGLVDVCESIGLCVELVLADLSYCSKLRKLPKSMGMLKKVKTLLLEGCSLGDSIGMSTKMPSSAIVEAIPSELKFFTISLPRSLVKLSLAYNNLFNESFPMDFSWLSMLRDLVLDGNPIVSLPNCVRTLPTLRILSINNCKVLTSVEYPPHTLTYLSLRYTSNNPSLRKIVFDPELWLLRRHMMHNMFGYSSFEIKGVIKIQPMTSVEEKVLHSLGWTMLDLLNKRRLDTYKLFAGELDASEIQMYYEFGIFSTIYGGGEIPSWITDRSMGPSISFTIPSSTKNLIGLNFSYVQLALDGDFLRVPMIIISNITKNLSWIYHHYINAVKVGEKCFTFSSHWMFGMNEMECGDNINIIVCQKPRYLTPYDDEKAVTKECGVNIMYDNGDRDEEDALSYYKSWDHIIGGDITAFQLTTGEYILRTWDYFSRNEIGVSGDYRGHIRDNAKYKVKMRLGALSQRKSNILGGAHEDVTK